MGTKLVLAMAMAIIGSFAGCALLTKRAYDKGRELDRKSRERGCHLADVPLVLLGGGMSGPHHLSRRSLDRVQGALAFLINERKDYPSTLVTSGGPVYSKDGSSEAALMKELLERASPRNLTRIIEENRSYTTVENARYTAELFEAQNWPKDIILLTEVFHLSRAAHEFEKSGFRVCAVSIAGP